MRIFVILSNFFPSQSLNNQESAKVYRDAAVGSANPITPGSVMGMCSASQDSLGSLQKASSSGITDIVHCAQYAHDTAPSSVYVSFSASSESCLWFANCQCLASSSTCLGGEEWASVAIADVIKPVSSAVVTMSGPSSKGSLVIFSASTTAQPGSIIDAPCDYSSSSLMQSFQTKCQMHQTVNFQRLVAGGVVLVVALLVAASFAAARFFDAKELKKEEN